MAIRKNKHSEEKMDGYLLGLKHGITLADLDNHYKAQLKEIEEMQKLLREKDGQENGKKDNPAG